VNLLALETSTNACSVALVFNGSLAERHVVQAKEHTRLLIPMIEEVLEKHNAMLAQLDAIVLGNGPGSFIGMRIAASVAQGLAYGSGLGIVPVSSLAAVAAEVFATTAVDDVAVAQDAHMNEVYLARFRRGKGGLPVADGETLLQPVGRIESLEGPGPAHVHAAGAGWKRYPQLLKLNADRVAGVAEVSLPRASFLLDSGAAALREGAVTEPAQLVPDYVRSRVASIPGSGSS
jgi:tRNA threonylcarbamoyladenosine biosynthesis protein TsaB